jgi:sulfur-oxidizing protein SoxY
MMLIEQAPSSRVLSRRRFLGMAAASAGLAVEPWMQRALAAERVGSDALHRPRLRLPAATSNGARVPVSVEVPHPMGRDHYVSVLEVVNPRDPVPLKGRFHFTPANGRAYIAFQARLDEGPSTLAATAECSRHGRATASAPVTIAEGGGGCVSGAPAAVAMPDDIRAPVIRIPQLIGDGVVRSDEIIDVQVKTKHPNRTGLVVRDGRFVQEAEPFHLNAMEVFYDREPISRFVLTAALSDNPLITFNVRARPGATLRVMLSDTRGERFEATHAIPVA